MKYAWIATHLEQFDLNIMCLALNIKKSSYFSWTEIDQEVRQLNQHTDYKYIEDTFYFLKENAGTRGIKGYLFHQKNIVFSRRKIGNIMRDLGLRVKTKKKLKKVSVAPANDPKIKQNVLNRHFIVSYPNQTWVGDITEIKTATGKLYLAAYIDLYSRKVVGWAIDTHMRSELVERALKRALWSRKPPKGLMVHTDQGSQFIRHNYRILLKSWRIKQSMSRRGNCWDNAVIESFFKTLKTEVIYPLSKQNRADEMCWLISEFMGHYNHDRPHSSNNYLSPNQFERIRSNEIAQIEMCLGTK
jgi:transposase InsO family protein